MKRIIVLFGLVAASLSFSGCVNNPMAGWFAAQLTSRALGGTVAKPSDEERVVWVNPDIAPQEKPPAEKK